MHFLRALLLAAFVAIVNGFLPIEGSNASSLSYSYKQFLLINGLLNTTDPNLGAADIWGDKWINPIPWGRNVDEHTVLIRYCYLDAETKNKFQRGVEAALELWRNALGDSSEQSGHALNVQEVEIHNVKQLCFKPGSDPKEWNDIPPDTVAISDNTADEDGTSFASIGRSREDPIRSGLHFIQIGSHWTVPILVHEFGHIFGMVHEHMRPDRDIFIEYNCEKVYDFDRCLENCEQLGFSKFLMCTDYETAAKCGFQSGLEFIKGYLHYKDNYINKHGDYDTGSVMHYPSSAFSKNGQKCTPTGDPGECPIAFWKNPWDHSQGKKVQWPTNGISGGDIQWVKDIYPWQKPSTGENTETPQL